MIDMFHFHWLSELESPPNASDRHVMAFRSLSRSFERLPEASGEKIQQP